MDSFSSDYLRKSSQSLSNPDADSQTWNSHYSLIDSSLSRGPDSTLCEYDQQPLRRELKFCELPEDIRCMYEMAKCGMPITESFCNEQDSMQSILDMSPSIQRDDVSHFESSYTPTWEEFKNSVDDCSSGQWEDNGESRYQQIMEEVRENAVAAAAAPAVKTVEVKMTSKVAPTKETESEVIKPLPDLTRTIAEYFLKGILTLVVGIVCVSPMIPLLLYGHKLGGDADHWYIDMI